MEIKLYDHQYIPALVELTRCPPPPQLATPLFKCFVWKPCEGDVTRDDLQCWNNAAAIRNIVATILQRCVALKIVVGNRPV